MWLVLGTLAAASAAPVLIAPSDMRTVIADPPKFQLDPTVPPSRCLVRVAVDVDGAPTDVEARGCPASHAAAASEAVRFWRWAPIRSEGVPAEARILVAVAFTGRGRVPVAPAPKCTYALRVSPEGAITKTGNTAPQCEIWPLARLAARPPSAGSCTVGVDATAYHDEPHWLDVSACAEGVHAAAAEIVGGSLYMPGAESTRFVLEFPTLSSRPNEVVTTFEIPSPGSDQAPTRLGTAAGASSGPDATLAVPTSSVPKVDLSALRDRGKAPPKPAPPPPPAPDPDAAAEESPPPTP